MKKISVIFGTRPDAIKLCPLILAFKKNSGFEVNVCVTGQHRGMLDQVLEVFEVKPDIDLYLMEDNQTLPSLTSKTIINVNKYLSHYQSDLIIVQGDTTTAFSSALASFYNKIPIGHVEAGLRTWNKFSPYPEEINRVLITHIADYHFAPTKLSKENLVYEGIAEDKIFITGNPVIDALNLVVNKIRQCPPQIPDLPDYFFKNPLYPPIVLITGHRRENFGKRFESICNAVVALADRFNDTEFIYPVHLNPNVRKPVFRIMSGFKNIHLIEPLKYFSFVALMDRCKIVLTDSGGVQEEAPSLGKPVLVMRDTTERPEAIDAGTAKLVGTDTNTIVENVSLLLTDSNAYNMMAKAVNPYGDGKACERIVAHCKRILTGD
ncbi:non-hydrolyzing UDP-N-acetylglucosamine 2-epimerase [Candidatus Latescibacterota bacterium]